MYRFNGMNGIYFSSLTAREIIAIYKSIHIWKQCPSISIIDITNASKFLKNTVRNICEGLSETSCLISWLSLVSYSLKVLLNLFQRKKSGALSRKWIWSDISRVRRLKTTGWNYKNFHKHCNVFALNVMNNKPSVKWCPHYGHQRGYKYQNT